jgi:hypothetical protein
VRFLGFDAPRLEARPGEDLSLVLYWQAQEDGPQAGPLVLQLAGDDGQVVAEQSATPAGGLAPFAGLEAGQAVRDPHVLALPPAVQPGVYNLLLGRRTPGGSWLPVRRGWVPLGPVYPLATVHLRGRELELVAPAPAQPAAVRFGDGILLTGFDLRPPSPGASPEDLELTLYWQALAPMTARHKIFVHLAGEGGPGDLHAQADAYPHLPTSAWVPGEYLADRVVLAVPAGLPPGNYRVLLGFYDEGSGLRMPVYADGGAPVGDSYELFSFAIGEGETGF